MAEDHRSFPEAADGRAAPPMAHELMVAGLSWDDACFVARQLRGDDFYLVRPSDIGWPEIRAFQENLRYGQAVREDGGGFFARCLRALLRLPAPNYVVENYQDCARRLLEEADVSRVDPENI